MKLEPLPHQVKRFTELQALIAEKEKLTANEYLAFLYEIQANYTIALAMRSAIGTPKDSGAFINILDKIHWLIDSAEQKAAPDKKDDNVVHVHFTPFVPDDTTD